MTTRAPTRRESIEAWLKTKRVSLWPNDSWDLNDPKDIEAAAEWFHAEFLQWMGHDIEDNML